MTLRSLCDEQAARRLTSSGNFRILRRLDFNERTKVANDNAGDKVGVCVDVETTGIDPACNAIIELSLRRFRFNEAGVITAVGRTFGWLEDPGRPLDPVVIAMTGWAHIIVCNERRSP